MALIAVLLNSNGETSSWLDNGTIKLYEKFNEEWIESKHITYSISSDSNLINLRKYLSELVEKLGDCKVFVAKEISGLLFSILESYNFNMYELQGIPHNFLESVLSSVEKLKIDEILSKSQSEDNFFPDRIDNVGNYSINLKKLLDSDRTITSKQILIPFLEKNIFKTLEVIFDHIPKWFEKDLSKMGFSFYTTTDNDGMICSLIYAKNKDMA